jgi:hypothetical protein
MSAENFGNTFTHGPKNARLAFRCQTCLDKSRSGNSQNDLELILALFISSQSHKTRTEDFDETSALTQPSPPGEGFHIRCVLKFPTL